MHDDKNTLALFPCYSLPKLSFNCTFSFCVFNVTLCFGNVYVSPCPFFVFVFVFIDPQSDHVFEPRFHLQIH